MGGAADDDDDDVIITNDGEPVERVKKTVTSTSVPGHKDVEIIGGELKPPCQKQDARYHDETNEEMEDSFSEGASEENVVERSNQSLGRDTSMQLLAMLYLQEVLDREE